jgi:hypothetical protein
VRIIELEKLRNIFSYGAKFRMRRPDYDPIAALALALDEHISRDRDRSKEAYAAWRGEVLSRCTANIGEYKDKVESDAFVLDQECKKYIRFLHKHLVIHFTDKAANNIAFRCKNDYTRDLRTELNSGVYSQTN